VMAVCILLFSIIAFVLTFLLYTTRENYKEKLIIAEKENAVLTEQTVALSSDVRELEDVKKDQGVQIAELSQEKRQVEDSLMRVTSKKEQAEDLLVEAKEDLSNIRLDYKEYKKTTADIVGDFKDQNKKLLNELQKLRQGMPSHDVSVPSLPGQVRSATNIPTVVVTPQNVAQGKVVVYNPSYKFVISNLGKQSGLALNDKVAVYRGNVMIAIARVEKLYGALSASGVEQLKPGYTVKEGDYVRKYR